MRGIQKQYLAAVGCIESIMLCMSIRDAEWTFSGMINYLAFGTVSISAASMIEFLMFWFPILFFQVLMGNYIYEHYCVSSVYFFSRCTKKVQWYLKETGKLYLYALAYIAIIVCSALIFGNLRGTVIWDETAGIFLGYYMVIYSLWLFMTTLFINVFAIIWDSTKSFVMIAGFQLGCMGLYGVLQDWMDFSEYVGEGMEIQILVLKAIPISNLVFHWHSSQWQGLPAVVGSLGFSYDFALSVLVLFVLALIALVTGVVVVKKADFIDNGGTM